MSNYDDNPWSPPDGSRSPRPETPLRESAAARPDGDAGFVGADSDAPEQAAEPTTQHAAYSGHQHSGEANSGFGSWYSQEQGRSEPTAEPVDSGYGGSSSSDNRGGNGGWFRWLAVATVAALVGAGVGATVVSAADDDAPLTATTATANRDRASTAIAAPSTIRSVLDRVQPAVVTIQVNQGQGNGTGMIISADGEILTNAHVVSGARQIQVTLNGERTARTARLLGADPSIDAALIKLENASNMPTVELGESRDVQVGDEVVAIGNALALPGGPSVTSGIISAKDRSISDPGVAFESLIQTDAAINPGNSGGPLVNMAGQVVGMNTVVIRGRAGEFENIGFAMPVDSIKPVLADLREGRLQVPAFLGVSTVTLDESIKERFDLVPNEGAVVSTVSPGSPADAVGLSRYDVITSFDGKEVTSNEQLVTFVRAKRPGDRVPLVFFRGEDRREVTVELASRPSQ